MASNFILALMLVQQHFFSAFQAAEPDDGKQA
jgi:hypothetical protein